MKGVFTMAFFEYSFRIGMRDIGKNNEITNKAILGFFEDIGGLHSDVVGYGLKNIYETKLSWVLLHWKLTVLKRAKYSDEVLVRTWSRKEFSKFYCYRDFEMYDKNSMELLAYGTSKWTLIHFEKGITRITEELVEKYHPENKKVYEEENLDKLKEPSSYLQEFNYQILRSNIDVNQHMHNLYYLDLAYETLPESIYQSANFSHVEIMYKRECKLGDHIKCLYSFENGQHLITIKSEDEKQLHAIIQLS